MPETTIANSPETPTETGFTLIEMSIVLVVIGLIVGGILVGQSLVKAAEVRATVTQVEKYNQAVNTFKGKYNELPGDISAAGAAQVGFTVPAPSARSGVAGLGDGNGVIEGYDASIPGVSDLVQVGEPLFFWQDLTSNSHLIEGTFKSAPFAPGNAFGTNTNPPQALIPAAKIGRGNYIYVYSRYSLNFFGLSAVSNMQSTGSLYSTPALTVAEAYAIDTKIDDGLPQSGTVLAIFSNGQYNYAWAGGGGLEGAHTGAYSNHAPSTAATPGSALTCYDNNNTIGTQQYSVEISNGSNINCALSFRFQ